jgi:glutamine amidotransferase
MIFGIVDYGMGNLRSVQNAFEYLGAEVRTTRAGDDLANVGAVVLPGVGAFGEGMRGLRERGFVDALQREVIERKKPMLGICLGMQLLGERGTELGEHAGLGWVPGSVDRLDGAGGLRIPHIGWNDVAGKGVLFAGLPDRTAFYFVHSFHLRTPEPAIVSGSTEYGETFASAVERENVLAVQFHPEKSHKHGLALLENFIAFAGRA